ncbi:MAG: hypoxanthine phosphoribosyltransferase [Coriobacteriales bacterium]|nr:hypoxanthine phosphoribosyltransferase [Coriobacteriales bacterium]
MPLPPECDAVLYSAEQIAEATDALGAQLTRAYTGEQLRLLSVLKGGLMFMADLARAVQLDVTMDFLAVQPYGPGARGAVRVTKDLDDDIADSRVVLVEDIVDTGLTLNYLLNLIKGHGPRSVDVCTLIDKPARRIAQIDVAFRGFEAPDRFLVGYGLDLGGKYRNLPYVATVRDEVMGL